MIIGLCLTAFVLGAAIFLSVYYPRKYDAEIAAACKEWGVEENLVRGMIHTESKFRPEAESGKGAVGLMQLMPRTAAWVAAYLVGDAAAAANLKDPETNIRLGTAYISYLLKKFSLSDALAAYNAGEGNVKQWQAEDRTAYPFPETAAYVKKVLRARKVYTYFRK